MDINNYQKKIQEEGFVDVTLEIYDTKRNLISTTVYTKELLEKIHQSWQ